MRMNPTDALAAARRNLRQLAYWAESCPGEKSLAFLGAVFQAKQIFGDEHADLDKTARALRTLVLWCEIGIVPAGRTLGAIAGMAERFLTVELGQTPVLADRPSHAIVFTDEPGAEPPQTHAEITVGTTEFTASGADSLAAAQALLSTLQDQMDLMQAAVSRVTATVDDLERNGPTPSAANAAPVQDPDTAYRALIIAAYPFYRCVFNDNGDVTVTTTYLEDHHWLELRDAVAGCLVDNSLKKRAQPFADCVKGVENGQVILDQSGIDASDWVGIDRAYREHAN